jgi:hypothetical protein
LLGDVLLRLWSVYQTNIFFSQNSIAATRRNAFLLRDAHIFKNIYAAQLIFMKNKGAGNDVCRVASNIGE